MALSPTSSRPSGGGAQAFVIVTLRHSADFSNVSGSVPSVVGGGKGGLTLPATAFANDGTVGVRVINDSAAAQNVGGELVVQNADGTKWIARDASGATVAAGDTLDINFSTDAGSGGVGLSWNAVTKVVDIAAAGAFSAFVGLTVQPA